MILYDRALLTVADRLLIQALKRRGFEVHVVSVAAARLNRTIEPSSAGRIRSYVETIFGRPVEKATRAGWAQLQHHDAGSATDLQRILTSIEPAAVISFLHPETLPELNPGCPLYELWIDGSPQTLAIERSLTSTGPSFEIIVTSRQRHRDDRQVVQRATLPALRTWAFADQTALARRSIVLLQRAINRAGVTAERKFVQQSGADSNHPVSRAVSNAGAAIHRRLIRRWKRVDAWFLAYRFHGQSNFKMLFGGSSRSFADPCVVRAGNEHFVFYEDYAYAEARGAISFSRLQNDGSLSPPERVLERPYHLSYPFVFEHAGQWWMVPETSANRTIDLYRAEDFPQRWQLHCTLLEEIVAVDATLHHDGKKWWMFVNVSEEGSPASDELSIYHAAELQGPWRQHARNPVKCDASSARPAGRLFERGGQLIRPTQDCSRIYGGGIRFCAIDILSETDFSEHFVETLAPSTIPGAEALHTWSADGDLEVIDARLPFASLDETRFLRQLQTPLISHTV